MRVEFPTMDEPRRYAVAVGVRERGAKRVIEVEERVRELEKLRGVLARLGDAAGSKTEIPKMEISVSPSMVPACHVKSPSVRLLSARKLPLLKLNEAISLLPYIEITPSIFSKYEMFAVPFCSALNTAKFCSWACMITSFPHVVSSP